MNETYYSARSESQSEIVINKSRFITTLVPIADQNDAIEKVKIISKKYSDATHNCYAFISNKIATEQRFSDDGEPQGTAGIPMLEVLKKRRIYMTLAVVTRYFGGVKLGANGLVGAYSRSVSEALNAADIVENAYSEIVRVKCDYAYYKKVESTLLDSGAEIDDILYDEKVTLTVRMKGADNDSVKDKIIDTSLGQAEIETVEIKYCEYKLRGTGYENHID